MKINMSHPFRRNLHVSNIKKHSLYNRWNKIKQCVFNPNCEHYHLYGGRGIIMDEGWARKFNLFLLWAVNNGYQKDLVLTRKDKNKGYTPDNCFFAENAYCIEPTKI